MKCAVDVERSNQIVDAFHCVSACTEGPVFQKQNVDLQIEFFQRISAGCLPDLCSDDIENGNQIGFKCFALPAFFSGCSGSFQNNGDKAAEIGRMQTQTSGEFPVLGCSVGQSKCFINCLCAF
ncbi:hypothetical protein [Allobaculum mucilyticum]|uniref:hypothetical protein n=1 Tax=Allobaculum mucilyticum TaxID=2834459 RepID=UPI003B8480A1